MAAVSPEVGIYKFNWNNDLNLGPKLRILLWACVKLHQTPIVFINSTNNVIPKQKFESISTEIDYVFGYNYRHYLIFLVSVLVIYIPYDKLFNFNRN